MMSLSLLVGTTVCLHLSNIIVCVLFVITVTYSEIPNFTVIMMVIQNFEALWDILKRVQYRLHKDFENSTISSATRSMSNLMSWTEKAA